MKAKLENVVSAALGSDEQVIQQFEGTSNGLNNDRGNAGAAVVVVTDQGVLVGWLHAGLVSVKALVERFSFSDVMAVADVDAPLTGMMGAASRKNATTSLGRAMGNSGSAPALHLQTRRGDVVIWFAGKNGRQHARESMVAISDRI